MAQEFLDHSTPAVKEQFRAAFDQIKSIHEPHEAFKRWIPDAIGLIRTADTIQYANMILVSA